MNVKFVLKVIFFLFLPSLLLGQRKQGKALVDSLLIVLPNAKEDSNKVYMLNDISFNLAKSNPKDGIFYGNQGLELAKKLSWKRGIGWTNNALGTNYKAKSDYDKALEYYFESLKIFEEIGLKGSIASVSGNIANIYSRQGDYTKALDYAIKALKVNKETGNKYGIAYTTGNIGNIYYFQANYAKALDYYLQGLKKHEELGNKDGIAHLTGNIGAIYYSQKNYPKALEYFLKALRVDEELGNKTNMASCLGNIGDVYFAQGNYADAKEYFSRALKMAEEMGSKSNIAAFSGSIGGIFEKQNDYAKALTYYAKTLTVAEEIGSKDYITFANLNIGEINCRLKNFALASDFEQKALKMAVEINNLDRIKDCYIDLAELCDSTGDFKKALEYNNKYHDLKDSIYSKESSLKISKLEDKAEYEHRADSIKLVEDTRALNLQKELQLNALRYAYEKKQMAAKTEGERQHLYYEEEIKRNRIKFDYEQKQLRLEAEQKKNSLIQQKKEALATEKLQEQKNYTYAGLGSIILLLGFLFFIARERRRSEVQKRIAQDERQKSDNLLLNILPGEIAEELKVSGGSKAQHYDNVTVLFTDFVDFTKAGERMTPQALVNELDTCFKAFDNITSKYNIEKIKTIGDAYLAVCGLPKADIAHAENVVHAALEIRDFMLNRHATLSDKTFEVRIGVHSGNVVAGIVGVKKFAYDIWGDTVNTAARMEQNSEPGKINISETTYELVHNNFTCEYRGEIEAKNKGMLKMYFVG